MEPEDLRQPDEAYRSGFLSPALTLSQASTSTDMESNTTMATPMQSTGNDDSLYSATADDENPIFYPFGLDSTLLPHPLSRSASPAVPHTGLTGADKRAQSMPPRGPIQRRSARTAKSSPLGPSRAQPYRRRHLTVAEASAATIQPYSRPRDRPAPTSTPISGTAGEASQPPRAFTPPIWHAKIDLSLDPRSHAHMVDNKAAVRAEEERDWEPVFGARSEASSLSIGILEYLDRLTREVEASRNFLLRGFEYPGVAVDKGRRAVERYCPLPFSPSLSFF